MSCVPIDTELAALLARFKDGKVPAADIPTDLLEQLRRWGWVIGKDQLELTGIGIYHAGPTEPGLLG